MSESVTDRPFKLYTPGPVNIPNRVAAASAMATYHHRTPEFRKILEETLSWLKPLFGTDEMVLPIHTTGRGALEGVYNNLFGEEDCVLSIANGSFGEMAVKTLRRNHIPCIPCFEGWETPVDLEALEGLIREHKATGITCVHSDTSNAVRNPIEGIGDLARKYGLLYVVDSVSALGTMPLKMDEWNVDVAVTASQKGLMSPTGLSFAAMSRRAVERCKSRVPRGFYVDLTDIRKSLTEKHETPGSTPVSLVAAVHEALIMIREEGLENVFARHTKLSGATKDALVSMGFTLFPKAGVTRSDSLTVCAPPKGLRVADLVSYLNDEFRLVIAKGLGSYTNELIRVSNIGSCYPEDMLMFFSAVECAMRALGFSGNTGEGTARFIESYLGLNMRRN